MKEFTESSNDFVNSFDKYEDEDSSYPKFNFDDNADDDMNEIIDQMDQGIIGGSSY